MKFLIFKKLVLIECTLLGVKPNDAIVRDVIASLDNIPGYLRVAVYMNALAVYTLNVCEMAMIAPLFFRTMDENDRLEKMLTRKPFKAFFRLFRGILFMSIGQEFKRLHSPEVSQDA
jgi:hypothetical protein